jgi:hypothetical protein
MLTDMAGVERDECVEAGERCLPCCVGQERGYIQTSNSNFKLTKALSASS